MSYTPGPKELAVKALREKRADRSSVSDLRAKVDEIKKRPPKLKKSKNGRKSK